MADLLTDADFDLFRKVIYDESGITFSTTNRSILDSRLKERLREKKMTDIHEYYKLISSNKEEMKTLLDSVTTNLTRFFRNQPHFDALEKYVIPHVLERKKSRGDNIIKIWSAGCSTGEEPYTIAMILKKILPPPYTFEIVASDLSLKSLMVGKQGFYDNSKITGIPPEYLDKYMIKRDNGYQVCDDIMKRIRFDYHNLKYDAGLRNLDIIFCRNVLIYFDEPAQLATINHFYDSLASQAYLFIGHSESLFGMKTKFEFLKTDWACLYQKNEK
ncbi:MAG: protein-glutamate O-methyltransferase CheR [Treponemataceae bacterium]|nr:protein-glutamate O-methyltransferase CheR [Treponemataceae bacterium]